ncbi:MULTISPECIES: DUF4352 domain-containing protein [unclassified Streptomyces]|uniref:DUF4352 domain-containing protein n=1 Tax=unclassified Streptomyces TaxID=2593676 RepID=UPI002ED66444|nr:DUF4352 domain-containing protein [Streptomyces sp. NBC_00891]WSY05963.1 DUF4352 domain-containing protein [Streptomyces sp. NBC_00890]WSZ07587.1 DUF4352 domain-containing protein [Streptomyces sp. NBC_00869]WSZ24914.1 DUF4352 domain-containing protein [Streptomyces sp. NBC_00870]
MRRTLALVLSGLFATTVACSAKTVSTTPSSTAPPSSAAAQETPATQPSPETTSPKPQASVGDTLDLTGDGEEGEQLAVTVVKVVDPAGAADEFSTPAADKRYVAVQFRLKNTGSAVYDDSPGNGTTVVDTRGQQFEATVEDTSAGPGFPGSVTIAPGDTGLGFITFEVPKKSTVAKIQFAMNSGFSGNTGQWTVPEKH